MKKYRRRMRLTEVEKAMMWDSWQQGDSLHANPRRAGMHAANL